MVLIFLLSLLSVAQFTLSSALNNRDSAIEQLGKQLGDLASQLSIEKKATQSLQKDLEQLTLQLGQARSERDRLNSDLAAERKSSDALKVERDQLTERLTSMMTERDKLSAALQGAAKEAEAKSADLQKEIERQRLELTRLAASLAAANNEKGKLFGDLTEEQKLTAEQKAAVVRLTAEMAGLKDELARLNAALDAADAKAKEQNAQIVDLGQKLNRALASKVEELARYRSEFFGKLREALAGQRDVQIVGDRFVFQSEVLFPSGSAQLQPGGEKQLASVAAAADGDRVAHPQGHQLGPAGRRPHRRQADQQRASIRRTGNCRRRAPSPSSSSFTARASPTTAWWRRVTASISPCRPWTPPATGASS